MLCCKSSLVRYQACLYCFLLCIRLFHLVFQYLNVPSNESSLPRAIIVSSSFRASYSNKGCSGSPIRVAWDYLKVGVGRGQERPGRPAPPHRPGRAGLFRRAASGNNADSNGRIRMADTGEWSHLSARRSSGPRPAGASDFAVVRLSPQPADLLGEPRYGGVFIGTP